MAEPVIESATTKSPAEFSRLFAARLRARGPELQASWPWQEPPARWVDRMRELVAEADSPAVYLDTTPGGEGVLRMRVDGAVLRGPTLTPEQHEHLLAELKKQAKVPEPTAEGPLTEGRLPAAAGAAAGDIWVGWMQTSSGAQVTLSRRTPLPAQPPWESWPEQARQALSEMRRHRQGLIVFFNHTWSMRRGEMVRVLHAWAADGGAIGGPAGNVSPAAGLPPLRCRAAGRCGGDRAP